MFQIRQFPLNIILASYFAIHLPLTGVCLEIAEIPTYLPRHTTSGDRTRTSGPKLEPSETIFFTAGDKPNDRKCP